MGKAADPFYNRKPVPDAFIKDVGITGLTPQEEHLNREHKYTANGADVRKFGTTSTGGFKPEADPYYGRKPVATSEIDGVGETGLTADEEFLNRERKYSVDGSDVRRFGNASGGFHPTDDPYYGRKKVTKTETIGIGETGNTPGQDFEARERKQSMFQLSDDPFALVSGTGHRQSVSDVGGSDAIAQQVRRRSSAVAPDVQHAHAAPPHHHSGYDGDRLEPIESKADLFPTITGASSSSAVFGGGGGEEHTHYYDAATKGHDHLREDPDAVAPHELR